MVKGSYTNDNIPYKTQRSSYNPILAKLEDLAQAEQGLQLHLPGHNYAGPGTHVISNILNGVQPVDYLDSVSLQHDLDYSRSSTLSEILKADDKMIKDINTRSDFGIFSAEDTLANLALKFKNILGSTYGVQETPLSDNEYSLLMELSRNSSMLN